MTAFGYARVSTQDQNLDLQVNALRAARCEAIRFEKVSASSTGGRAELRTLLDFPREGHPLGATRVDRLARSIRGRRSITDGTLTGNYRPGRERPGRRA